jgi:hypothetical protein
MSKDELHSMMLDSPHLAGAKRSQLAVASVLCEEDEWAVCELKSGKYAFARPNQVEVMDSLEDLSSTYLNYRQRELLKNAIQQN